MPMIDIYAAAGTFADKHQLAADAAAAVMRVEQVPDIPMFRQNTAAFVHELPADCLSNVDGDSGYVRVQVLTNAGALDRSKQLSMVRDLTELVAAAATDSDPDGADLGVADRGAGRRVGSAGPCEQQRRAGHRRPHPDRAAARVWPTVELATRPTGRKANSDMTGMGLDTKVLHIKVVDGLELRYADTGERRASTLLMTNPWPESLLAFRRIWGVLAGRSRLVAIDLPGFGHSEGRADLFAPSAMAEFINSCHR